MKMFETTNQLVSLGNEATRTYSKHEENPAVGFLKKVTYKQQVFHVNVDLQEFNHYHALVISQYWT